MYDKQSPFSADLRPKRQESLSDSAHSTIQNAIIDCLLPPGSVVSEAELGARFAFGLAAVRAAMIRLAEAGWTAPDGRRGSTILPVSASHLADLQASRLCLEPALTLYPPSTGLRNELRLRATVYRASTGHGQTVGGRMLLHQERAMLLLISQSVATVRLRNWLSDTWDLCLRADFHMNQAFGIARDPLPLAELAFALADNNVPGSQKILAQMRQNFDLRIAGALSRSSAALVSDKSAASATGSPKVGRNTGAAASLGRRNSSGTRPS